MGFWGLELILRGDHEVGDAEAVALFGGESAWRFDSEGWQLLQLYRADPPTPDHLTFVSERLSTPVLAAYITGSDAAYILFVSPGGPVQWCVLNALRAPAYDMPVDPEQQVAAVDELAAWAGESANRVEIAKALELNFVFAEDGMLYLAAALGALPLQEATVLAFGGMKVSSTDEA